MFSDKVVLMTALSETNQLLMTLVPDPKIPDDQKQVINQRIAKNKEVIKAIVQGSEVSHA